MRKTKKFSELILELKKMSFMDLVNMSDDLPDESEVESKPKPKFEPEPKPEPKPAPAKYVVDDDDDEPAREVQSQVGELQISKTVRELLGPKLFANYASLKKIEPELDVMSFIKGEIKDLEKALPKLKGSDLSGAKTRLRLLGAKLEDAEMVMADADEASMGEFVAALERAKVNMSDVVEDDTRISIKFQIAETDLRKLADVIKEFGGKPGKYDYTPPYDHWFADGSEWRVYPPQEGSVKVHATFARA